MTIEQTLHCCRVFQAENQIFQYGTQQREAEHQQFGRQLVHDGKLGQLKAIEVKAPDGSRGGSTEVQPVQPGFDYAMWLGPAPEVPYTADRCKPPGTYMIYDQSIGYLAGWSAHPLDIMVWCYQGDQAGPFSIEGTGTVPTDGLYNTVILSHLCDIAIRTGEKLTWNPRQSQLVNASEKARTMISRPMRPPWTL